MRCVNLQGTPYPFFYGMSAVFGVKSGFQWMKMGLFSN